MTKIESKREINQIRSILNIVWQNIYYLLFFLIIFEIIAYYSFTDYNKRSVSHAYRVNYIYFEPTEFLQQEEKLLKILREDISTLFGSAIFNKKMFEDKDLINPSFEIIKNFTALKSVLPSTEVNRAITKQYIINEIVKDFTFDTSHFTNDKLVSKKIDKFDTRLVFYFQDEVNLEKSYEISLNDYILKQSNRIFQDFRKSYLKDIEIKIIEINNIISFFNGLKVDENIEPIEQLDIDHPIFLPLIKHINDFYSNDENFPIKFFKLNNISEFPNVAFLPYFISFNFFAIIFFVLFIFLKTLYKNLNDKKS